jgi:hypothetical protein
MTEKSIVEQLRGWLASRKPKLTLAGVDIVDRLPGPSSDVQWSGNIGLVKDNIFVSFTVWELTIFQTELIVVDGSSKKTLVSEDGTPKSADEIDSILDSVVNSLISGKFAQV